MRNYKHIFFDLDHTLWDYDANAREALYELYERYGFGQLGLFEKELLADTFFEVNEGLWDLYNRSEIQRRDIRERRFPAIFQKLDASLEHMPYRIEEEYIALAPTKNRTFEAAHEVLDYLNEKYMLHIITNGFDDIQATKLQSSQLDQYFDVVITSESSKMRKPDPRIFELALDKTDAALEESIMIGDNLNADIAGAVNVGMDHVWFNPNKISTDRSVQHEIQNLIELKSIL
ncbi:YjjG family noncanonical pyrimidine nucleotidase [Roseivirga sp. E12]|uniref:YjjG family noncanonical pyrimidine nucleotidase n=1 Tax=Roseivirga sp. E12 TaxID=2819237 RepID=UPI001ABCB532|nr:YjjG family noncanonical pyrimidine nucleotidase [Roseivirga sp. E12]MBO3698990.1 YjjG family noncanonical pyrimidine nucleotidase [Roseivirga sp. E12]